MNNYFCKMALAGFQCELMSLDVNEVRSDEQQHISLIHVKKRY